MADISGLVLLLLPLAAAAGWFAASIRRPEEEEAQGLDPQYVKGLSHLVNNDTDQAVEVFIGLLDADDQTVDLHLALGSLFRRRGEVDRALRIHQNLVLRPKLKPVHRNQARYELAKDYLKAGVLDRAEEIFLELANQGMFLSASLAHLAQIYEREREWLQAIDVTRWRASADGQDLGSIIAQYYCEIALQAERADDDKGLRNALKKALAADRGCVRAYLLQASREQKQANWAQAIKIYRQIADKSPDFVTEVLDPLEKAYQESGQAEHWYRWLQEEMQAHAHPKVQLALLQARLSHEDAALEPLLKELAESPNWTGLHAALLQPWDGLPENLQDSLRQLAQALGQPLEKSAAYRCDNCGYSSRVLNWQCPSCSRWNTTIPLKDMSYGALSEAAHAASAVAND